MIDFTRLLIMPLCEARHEPTSWVYKGARAIVEL